MDIYVTEYILGEGASANILEKSLEKERMTGATQRANFRKAVRLAQPLSMAQMRVFSPTAKTPNSSRV